MVRTRREADGGDGGIRARANRQARMEEMWGLEDVGGAGGRGTGE